MWIRQERILGLLLLASGSASLALAPLVGWLMFKVGNFSNGIGFIVGVIAFALMTVTGFQVLRGSRWFPWFVPVALAAQIPVIEGGRFSYAIMSIPGVEWQLWPLFGFSIATAGTMRVVIDHGDRPFSLAINLLALFLLIWTDRYLGEPSVRERPAA